MSSIKRPCTNCGTTKWAAKNDEYCTSCEKQWYETLNKVYSTTFNPNQQMSDELLEALQKPSKCSCPCHEEGGLTVMHFIPCC